jgi:hypothetical protein
MKWIASTKRGPELFSKRSFLKGIAKVSLQGGGYPPDRNGHLYIDGINRYIQDLRYFFIAETVFPDKLEDHLAAGRKGVYCGLYLLVHFRCDEDLFGIDGRSVQFDPDMVEGLGNAFFCFFGEIIKGGVLGGGVKVNAKVLYRPGVCLSLPESHEDVFYYFFGQLTGLDNGEGEMKQPFVEK